LTETVIELPVIAVTGPRTHFVGAADAGAAMRAATSATTAAMLTRFISRLLVLESGPDAGTRAGPAAVPL
jgi:hypothetical protein